MVSRHRIYGAIFGLAYAIIYFFSALFATGAGHGTYIFFIPLWPYMIGGLFFPLFGYLGADLSTPITKVAYLVLVLFHYSLMVVFYLYTDLAEWEYVEKVWQQFDIGIILPTLVFLLGQLIIWLVFLFQVIKDSRSTSTA